MGTEDEILEIIKKARKEEWDDETLADAIFNYIREKMWENKKILMDKISDLISDFVTDDLNNNWREVY